jgi:hypothetical protein
VDVPAPGNAWNVASLPIRTGDLVPSMIVAAGLIAATAVCLPVALSRWSQVAAALMLILLFVPATSYSQDFLVRHSQFVYPSGWTSPAAALEDEHAHVVGYDLDHDDLMGGVYQWFLWDTRVVPFSGRGQVPPSPYLISSGRWPKEHPGRPATALWKDPARDQTLWRLTEPAAQAEQSESRVDRTSLRRRARSLRPIRRKQSGALPVIPR